MTSGYIRLSRCLFTRHIETGDEDDAIAAAEAVERHRARRLRSRSLQDPALDLRTWLVAPLRSTAALLGRSDGVACLAVHPHLARIEGRWMVVGLQATTEIEPWTESVSPPEILLSVHGWFGARMNALASAVSRHGTSPMALAEQIESHLPADAVLAAMQDLWNLIGPPGPVRHLLLSTQAYALELPWAGAAVAAGASTVVSVVPSTALARSVHERPPNPTERALIVTADDHLLYLAATSTATVLAGGGQWSVEVTRGLPGLTRLDDLDLLVLLGHGDPDVGLATGVASNLLLTEGTAPRVSLLLGCWSSRMTQDDRHLDLEGVPVQMLEVGCETVVASLWPLGVGAATTVVEALATALGRDRTPAEAFADAQGALRSGDEAMRHPAVWGSLALYGSAGIPSPGAPSGGNARGGMTGNDGGGFGEGHRSRRRGQAAR